MKSFHPSHLALFLVGITLTAFLISALHAAGADQQAVLAPVMALFDGMANVTQQRSGNLS